MMGASPTDEPRPVPAAVLSTGTPELSVEQADDGTERVYVEGTMYHTGLNANAWGLTKSGAERIAQDLIGRDYTAAHPTIRGTQYDRSIAEGQGAPIGVVDSTEVISVDKASIDGGGYTAAYRTEVLDERFKDKMTAGLYNSEGYGVSVGIYADPESATCSVCEQEMASDDCGHSRGEIVESDDGEEMVAGPLYSDGEADHLAHVWRPAYEGATADVNAAADDGGIAAYSQESAESQHVLAASEVLGAPHDARDHEPVEDDDDESVESTSEQSAYQVAVSSAATRRRERSYPVRTNND